MLNVLMKSFGNVQSTVLKEDFYFSGKFFKWVPLLENFKDLLINSFDRHFDNIIQSVPIWDLPPFYKLTLSCYLQVTIL